MRLIDADKAEKQFTAQYCESCNSYNGVKCRACEARDGADVYADMPTIDPVKHAHWVDNTGDSGTCCNCGERCDFPLYLRETGRGTEYIPYEYCPHCGYMMDEVSE